MKILMIICGLITAFSSYSFADTGSVEATVSSAIEQQLSVKVLDIQQLEKVFVPCPTGNSSDAFTYGGEVFSLNLSNGQNCLASICDVSNPDPQLLSCK